MNALSLDPINPLIAKMMADFDRPGIVEFESGGRRINFEKIESEDTLGLMINRDIVHPEAFALIGRAYQIAGCINYGPLRFRAASENGENERESLIRQLMGRTRISLGLNGKRFFWIGCTEYGYGNRPHTHFLISVPLNSIENQVIIEAIQSSFAKLASDLGELTIGDLNLSEVSNSVGAVAYLCKEEYGHRFKTFHYSTSLVTPD